MPSKSPSTPGRGKKKLGLPKSPGGMTAPGASPGTLGRHSMQVPAGFDSRDASVLVYEKKKGTMVKNVPGRKQGVWQDGYSATMSPTELWLFPEEKKPEHVEGSKHIHGIWGLDPNSVSPGEPMPKLDTVDPMQIWFFSPGARTPKYFTPRGIWTYPLVKKDITQLLPEEAGFLHVADSVKAEKLDVAGSWKMLYRRDGLPESPIGPGVSPRKKKAAPKPMTVFVRTPDGEKIPIEGVRPADTIQSLKLLVEDKEGTPHEDQRLVFDGKELDSPKKMLGKCGVKDGDMIDLEGITIFVQNPDGQKMEFVNLEPRATIDEVKELIEDHPKGISRRHQRLTFKGQPVTRDSRSLKDCGIVHQSTLHLEPMEITVKTPQGQSVPLQVEPSSTMHDVKQKIQNKTGIPPDEQRLMCNGKDLGDPNKTLEDSGIAHGDKLDMDSMQIYIQDWNERIFEMDVDLAETIDEIKNKIRDQHNIPKAAQRLSYKGKPFDKDTQTLRHYNVKNKSTLVLEPMNISVQLPGGKMINLQVEANETIADVKEKVEEKEGIPQDEQRLTHKGKHLGDGTTLEENRIEHASTLNLEPMEIYVCDPKGKRYTLELDPSETLGTVKNKIRDQAGIPMVQQRLTYDGNPLNKDTKSLREYNIQHKSTLHLEPMEIKVRLPSGKEVILKVDPKDCVQDVKGNLRDKESIPVDEQRLEFIGRPLKDKDTLAIAGVKHGDTVDMKHMEIFIRDPHGNKFPVEVQPTHTISEVKTKIEAQENIPRDGQRLAFNGNPLNKDNKTLRSCDIKHQSTLDLETMTINVETSDGKKIPVHVDPNDTIANVKKQVEDQHHIPMNNQRVAFNGKDLADQSTLNDNGIKHSDTVQLSSMQIIIKDWKHKTMSMDVSPSDTIGSIRERISEVKEIEPSKQILTFKDRLLNENESTLAENKIKHLSTLNVDRFKIYVEVPSHGKFLMEVDPIWKIKRIKQSVEARFKVKPDAQEPKFNGTILAGTSSVEDCGIQYKDTVVVTEINVPEYDVRIGPWQDPFNYTPKSPYKKKEGIRAKTTHDRSEDTFAEGKTDTTLTADVWSNEEDK